MSKRISILFYLKKPKNYTSGPVPIYARITIEGQRNEIAISREVLPRHWVRKKERSTGRGESNSQLNKYLETVKTKLLKIHHLLIKEDLPITPKEIKDRYLSKPLKIRTLVPIFQNRIKEMEMLVGIDYVSASVQKYVFTLAHLTRFLHNKYSLKDIDILSIDHAFIKDFEFYLKTKGKCGHNTTMKYMTNLKAIVRICLANNWIQVNPFAMVRLNLRDVETIFLDEEELGKLHQKEFSKRYDQVRDVYLFCCYTGLAYSDVSKLAAEHLYKGIDGNNWISIKRTKTETPSRIPLLPLAEAILDKYSYRLEADQNARLLPVCSNQKMNESLKVIARKAGIRKALTTHTARHTFATTVTLTNDVPLETVSRMLGHKSLKHTQHYAKVVDKKVSRDMVSLREKFKASENNTQVSVTA